MDEMEEMEEIEVEMEEQYLSCIVAGEEEEEEISEEEEEEEDMLDQSRLVRKEVVEVLE